MHRERSVKRIAIFADGTWNSPERGGVTNVLHLARGVKPVHQGHEQVAFYDWGVGTDRKKLLGGMSGAGIDKNITDCYRFIVHNFEVGDQLFLFGFSRGAYTARSLGIPVPFWGNLGAKEFLFHDTEPSKIIRHARHALAIDENREDFQPTLWDAKPDIDLRQVWFSGVHSNVGGSYDDRGLSDHALRWMVDEAASLGLGFEDHTLNGIKPDHRGKLYNSRRGIYLARSKHQRTIHGPIHESVKQRWQEDVNGYQSRCKPLRALLTAVGNDWSKIPLEAPGN